MSWRSLRLTCGAEEWTVQIGWQTVCFSVKGLDENQRRRLLKQQVYLVLCEQGQTQVHPWGIMTGVRPTKIARRYRERGLSSAATKQTLQKEYLLSEEKADLLLEVTERQRPFLYFNTFSKIFLINTFRCVRPSSISVQFNAVQFKNKIIFHVKTLLTGFCPAKRVHIKSERGVSFFEKTSASLYQNTYR